MTDLPDLEPPFRPGLRIHPPETWDRAREDYLAGLSGPAVCARHGLGLSAFRRRAATEGWRRSDQPVPMRGGPIEVEGDLNDASYLDLAEMAAIHLREAIANGRSGEASAWLRIHLRLDHASLEEAARGEGPRPAGANELDELDGVFSAPESAGSPESGRSAQ
jgi:hypothetical protein